MPGTASEWTGWYYDGQTAAREEVVVRPMPEGLEIHRTSSAMLFWPYPEMRRVAESVGGAPLRFERGGQIPETLIVTDHSLLEGIRAVAPGTRLGSPAATGSRTAGWLVVLLIAVVLALFFLYRFALPAIGAQLAVLIPVSWEEALGREVTERFAPAGKRCDDQNLRSALEHIILRLQQGSPTSPYKYRVAVLNTEQVNAFAAPGGNIVVFTGLIGRTKSPEELAGVLAHEIEHVESRHGTRAIFRSLTFWALVSLLTGDANATVVQLAGTLMELRYGRDDESHADRAGIERMQRARIDPQGMLRAFRMLEREAAELPAPMQYFSTHPRLADRMTALERFAATPSPHEALLPGRPWPPVMTCAP